jgi:hypothetical protein
LGINSLQLSKSDSIIEISNKKLQLQFLRSDLGFGIYSISNITTGYNFLDGEAKEENIWKITLKDAYNEFITIDNTIDCKRKYKIDKSQDGKTITLHLFWNDIEIDEEVKALLDVDVRIRLDEFGMSYWKININNNSNEFGQQNKGYGVWEVIFPAVRGIKAAKSDSLYLAYPRYLGQLIKNPIERMPLPAIYPSYRAKMQFSTLFKNNGKNALYLGTFDSEAHQKKFLYELDQKDQSLKWMIINYPAGMGQTANGYNMPYEAVIGVYEGDWITASKIYRKWAVNQFWCSKGKLIERDDIPRWYLNTVLWFSGMLTDKMIPLAKFMDVPIAYQCYNWHEVAFDSYYPDYFPSIKGFPDKVKELQNAGIKVIPYINSRVWEVNSKSWQNENPYSAATKGPYKYLPGLSIHNWGYANKDLAIYYDHWAGYCHAVMCPTTKIWQDKQSEIVNRLISEYNVDGVYMDQIASFYPMLCFDPGHQHSLGGGNYWVNGYRQLIEFCKKNSRKINHETIFTSEGHVETYLDLFDGNLACNSTSVAPELIPMFHFVYSGYCLTFGRATGKWHTVWDGDTYTTGLPLIMRNAQMFVWGEQLGWFNPNVLDFPGTEAEYLKTLCHALCGEDVKKYLFYGEMLRPPVLSGDNPILKAKWAEGQEATELPAVMHSAWKGEDGSLGLVFTNIDSLSHMVSFSLDLNNYQLPDSKQYCLKVLSGTGKGRTNVYKSHLIDKLVQIESRNYLILEIKSINEIN